jgi:hypothetical protein
VIVSLLLGSSGGAAAASSDHASCVEKFNVAVGSGTPPTNYDTEVEALEAAGAAGVARRRDCRSLPELSQLGEKPPVLLEVAIAQVLRHRSLPRVAPEPGGLRPVADE